MRVLTTSIGFVNVTATQEAIAPLRALWRNVVISGPVCLQRRLFWSTCVPPYAERTRLNDNHAAIFGFCVGKRMIARVHRLLRQPGGWVLKVSCWSCKAKIAHFYALWSWYSFYLTQRKRQIALRIYLLFWSGLFRSSRKCSNCLRLKGSRRVEGAPGRCSIY